MRDVLRQIEVFARTRDLDAARVAGPPEERLTPGVVHREPIDQEPVVVKARDGRRCRDRPEPIGALGEVGRFRPEAVVAATGLQLHPGRVRRAQSERHAAVGVDGRELRVHDVRDRRFRRLRCLGGDECGQEQPTRELHCHDGLQVPDTISPFRPTSQAVFTTLNRSVGATATHLGKSASASVQRTDLLQPSRHGSSWNGSRIDRGMATRSSKKIRYAVVGLGHIAQVAVLPAFAHAKRNSVLHALISHDAQKLAELGERYGTPVRGTYDDYEDCLREVDAVYIALPNSQHAQFTMRAANAGVHVLCEKPLAVTDRECQQMITACRDAQRQADDSVPPALRADDVGSDGDGEERTPRRPSLCDRGVFHARHAGGHPDAVRTWRRNAL